MKKFADIQDQKELYEYLTKPFTYLRGLKQVRHYTSLEVLSQILINKTLRFSKIEASNDALEIKWCKGNAIDSYFFSLVKSKMENFGMASMYGSLKISDYFSMSENKKKKLHKKEPIYICLLIPMANIKNLCKSKYKNIPSPVALNVAYANQTNKDSVKGSVLFCGSNVNRKSIKLSPQKFAGCVKDYAWKYENELRLCVKTKQNSNHVDVEVPSDFLDGVKVIPVNSKKEECQEALKQMLENKKKLLEFDIDNQIVENKYFQMNKSRSSNDEKIPIIELVK